MSDEAKQKARERMQAYHAKKREALKPEAPVEPIAAVPEPSISYSEYQDLLKTVGELKSALSEKPREQPSYNHMGMRVGTLEKYNVRPSAYPDPRERLASEPRLATFAFPINYELAWDITTTEYDQKDGTRAREPKFEIKLLYIMRDEEGIATNERAILRRAVFHEDPQAALIVAHEQGVDVDAMGEKEFLDEMRYLRIKDWLLEAFYQPKSTASKKRLREQNVGNQVVEIIEVSSADSQPIKFSELAKKLRA